MEVDKYTRTAVIEPMEAVIPMCINGAPGFSDPQRNAQVSPVIYGPNLATFHRDFVLAVGEYYSTYLFMLALHLQEVEKVRARDGLNEQQNYEFRMPCPCGSESFAWLYSDAVNFSSSSRADAHVYHEYKDAILIHPSDAKRLSERTHNFTTIWEIFIEKAPELFIISHKKAVENLKERGHFDALALLQRTSFRFLSSVDGRYLCDSKPLESLKSIVTARHGKFSSNEASGMGSASGSASSSHTQKKCYHDKLEDSDISDEDSELNKRYKVCRYSTKRNEEPLYGPCITSREVEDNVPPGICWGHWQRFHKNRDSTVGASLDESQSKSSSSHYCTVM